MNLQHFIVNVLLITVATAAVLDQEPPVFTYCPDDIVVDDVTTYEIRVYWPKPVATDNSGVSPYLASNRQNGSLFAVPSLSEVLYLARDDSGNEARCSFRITLKRKTCTLYAAPKNGALACFKNGEDNICAAMCMRNFDFVFSPPLVYFCSNAKWNFFSLPGFSYESQVPWPDCSAQASPSSLNKPGIDPYFYFDGDDANDPNVQDAIKTKFIDLMINSGLVPPFFCQPCTKENIKVYV
ncbi:hypothetical protein ACROYT_G019925 [Oculina patagonica]